MISQRSKTPDRRAIVQSSSQTFKAPTKRKPVPSATSLPVEHDQLSRQTKRPLRPPSSLEPRKIASRKTSAPPISRMGNEQQPANSSGNHSGSIPDLLVSAKGKRNARSLSDACSSSKADRDDGLAGKVVEGEDLDGKSHRERGESISLSLSLPDRSCSETRQSINFTVPFKFLPKLLAAGKGATILFGNKRGEFLGACVVAPHREWSFLFREWERSFWVCFCCCYCLRCGFWIMNETFKSFKCE